MHDVMRLASNPADASSTMVLGVDYTRPIGMDALACKEGAIHITG